MRKFNFLAICLFSAIAFSSCTKEAIQQQNNVPVDNSNSSNVTVQYSEWTPASTMVWSDTTIEDHPFIQATFAAPITESMINNSSILVYAKRVNTLDASVFPAMIYDSNNDYELLESVNTINGIQIFHTRNVGGNYERPDEGSMAYRYILIDMPVAPNGRPDTMGAPQYSMSELQTMSYNDVLNALGIPE